MILIFSTQLLNLKKDKVLVKNIFSLNKKCNYVTKKLIFNLLHFVFFSSRT